MVEPDQGQESEHDQRETLRRLSLVEFLSVIFNAVLALTAIAGSCFLYRQTNATEEQLKAMRGQLAEMKGGSIDTHNLAAATGSYAADMKRLAEQTKALAASGKTSADASKVSANNSNRIARGSEAAVKTAQSSVQLDQRAWIGVTNITGKPVVGEALKIRVMYQNTGRTPATAANNSCLVAGVERGKQPVFPPFAKATLAADQVVSRSVFPPNGSGSVTGSIFRKDTLTPYPFTQADVDRVTNGAVVLYVRALITYDDIFGRHHWITACYTYDPNNTTPDQYNACEWGNLVDRDGEPPPP
jgi:hypothetical protein